MARAATQVQRSDWRAILVTAGLAAAISALAGFINETGKATHESAKQRCDLAMQLLQDEQPNPYLPVATHRREALLAARRYESCLRGAQ